MSLPEAPVHDERLQPLLDSLSPERADAVRRFAAWMAQEGLVPAGHERVGPTLRLAFADERRRLWLSAEEMRALLHTRDQGLPVELPWVAEGE